MRKAFTLIEVLVTLAVFGVLMTATTVILTGVLVAARKSAAVGIVKGEGTYAIGVINEMVRFASDVTVCDNTNNAITFIPRQGASPVTLACVTGVDSYIASNSARLTSDRVTVSNCVIACDNIDPTAAKKVNVSFDMNRAGAAFVSETASTHFGIQIGLRNRE